MTPPDTLTLLARLEVENATLRHTVSQLLRHIEALEGCRQAGDTDTPTHHRSSSLEFEKFKTTQDTASEN